ncbi:Uncharacterised protein [uncultured archaeon]|nr:Uncharacterised protein [uncultured archaeon]
MLARQKAEAKEFSAKAATISVAFVAVSAVAPAMFQAYIVVGSAFMEMQFTPLQGLAITCVAFPVADIAMLSAIWAITPEHLKG